MAEQNGVPQGTTDRCLALEALCAQGGTCRVAVFPNGTELDKVTFVANVQVSFRFPDKAGIMRNIIEVSGSFKRFTGSGKEVLDFSNSRSMAVKNVKMPFGFFNLINVPMVRSMLEKITITGDRKRDYFTVEFSVDERGVCHRVERKQVDQKVLLAHTSELLEKATPPVSVTSEQPAETLANFASDGNVQE